jgi:transposase-like protein
MNLYSLAKSFPTEEHALAYWMKVQWPKGVRCISCDHDKCYLLETKGKTGKPARLFECGKCKHHFSATAGTLFHDSHLPLQKWFMAIALMAEAKKGISANQVRRHIGVTYKTAWFLCQRIRQAMQEMNPEPLGSEGQVVEIDEMYVGGQLLGEGVKGGKKNKMQVLGIIEREGRIHLQSISNTKAETLKPILDAKISPNASEIVTDGAKRYMAVIPREKHKAGNHQQEQKQRGRKLSNQFIESAFSLFKRGYIGSYHKLSFLHLNKYLGEFCWRFNRRKMQPWMFEMVLTSMAANGPMPYKQLTKF